MLSAKNSVGTLVLPGFCVGVSFLLLHEPGKAWCPFHTPSSPWTAPQQLHIAPALTVASQCTGMGNGKTDCLPW